MGVGTSSLIQEKGSPSLKKIAIIGASYLQNPLILKAKELGFETHVFAWQCGDVGERTADYFYPISIVEKDLILAKCKEIGVDGVCSIGSDLANIVVSYVASSMGLVSTPSRQPALVRISMQCVKRLSGMETRRRRA